MALSLRVTVLGPLTLKKLSSFNGH